MERLKASKFVSNFSRAIPDSEAKANPSPVVESPGLFPTHASIGALGTSNAALGASDGEYLHLTITSLGNSALLEALSAVRRPASPAVRAGSDVCRPNCEMCPEPVIRCV